ncbi:MAG TPA: glutamate--tRNA ligase [bacterium]|nr:glutamate--tRNA ligase [bacterium]
MRVRFAPSPTGYLHIGNARTALFNWLFARKMGGTFILRIEDTDLARSTDEYAEGILSDLAWLKLAWNEGPDIGGDRGPYKQSLRQKIYDKYLDELKGKGLAYPCFCQPDELEARRKAAMEKGTAPRYDNRCRALTQKEIAQKAAQGVKPSWRFKVPERTIVVDDVIRGKVEFDTRQLGDFVIMKSDGVPTFHFAVSVDDTLMEITHVIRGEDHLSNTPRHILLFESLGFTPPRFAHLPMILGPDGERLSKRHGAASVSEFRKLGYLPEALNNYLALLGWAPEGDKEILSMDELVAQFSLEKVNRSASTFDYAKLKWVSENYIRNEDLGRIALLALPYLREAGLIEGELTEEEMERVRSVVKLVRPYLACMADVAEHARPLLAETAAASAGDLASISGAAQLLQLLAVDLEKVADIRDVDWKKFFGDLAKASGLKGKALYRPIRIAITGQEHGPELLDVIPVLGKERCIARVRDAILKITEKI